MSRSLIFAIYYVVLILAIGLSSFFSFQGFKPTLEHVFLVVPFVLIIALGLFAAGALVQIARDRKSLKEQLLALFLFSVFAIFSTASNFTYLYTNMRAQTERNDAIVEERATLERALRDIRTGADSVVELNRDALESLASETKRVVLDGLSESVSVLAEVPAYVSFETAVSDLRLELDNMLVQALDPSRPGCGPRCRAHYETVNDTVTQITGVPLTEIMVPTDPSQFAVFYDSYQRSVWQSVCQESQNLTAIYAIVVGSTPSNYCVVDIEATRQDIADLQLSTNNVTIATVEDFLLELDEMVTSINAILTNAQALTDETVILPAPSTNINTAVENRNSLGLDISFPVGFSTELAREQQEFLQSLEDDIENMSADHSLFPDESSCAVERINVDPRNCLRAMSVKLEQVKTSFARVFPNEALPIDNELAINVENGQVGNIWDTLFNGFVELPSPQSTIFALFFGLMIDVLPLIFAFVAFHGYERPEQETDPWEAIV